MSELAQGARLEIVCAAKSGTEGSNPSLSAIRTWLAICEGSSAIFPFKLVFYFKQLLVKYKSIK